MEELKVEVFVQGVVEYFNKMTDAAVEVRVPYLKDEKSNVLLGHTGVVGISGKVRGAIYLTADDAFLSDLISRITPGAEASSSNLSAMVGELANTIAGNAQRTLGQDYHISIPILFTSPAASDTSTLELTAPTFVVPLRWREHNACLVVALRREA